MTIVGVTGHQDIPVAARSHVTEGIADLLRVHEVDLVGVCSLAAGADQLFAQAVLDRGGALHVVIPCERYDDTFHADERVRYHQLLHSAAQVEVLAHPEPSEEAFLDAGHRVVDLCDVLVAYGMENQRAV